MTYACALIIAPLQSAQLLQALDRLTSTDSSAPANEPESARVVREVRKRVPEWVDINAVTVTQAKKAQVFRYRNLILQDAVLEYVSFSDGGPRARFGRVRRIFEARGTHRTVVLEIEVLERPSERARRDPTYRYNPRKRLPDEMLGFQVVVQRDPTPETELVLVCDVRRRCTLVPLQREALDRYQARAFYCLVGPWGSQ